MQCRIRVGRSLEELTHGQRSDLNQQAGFDAGDEASNIMVGLVANQLCPHHRQVAQS